MQVSPVSLFFIGRQCHGTRAKGVWTSLAVQVSISGQAVVFVVRTMSHSLLARAGAWTYIAFFLAQVIICVESVILVCWQSVQLGVLLGVENSVDVWTDLCLGTRLKSLRKMYRTHWASSDVCACGYDS